MLDFRLTLLALIPTRLYEEVPMPQVRSGTQLVRTGRRRPDPAMSVWANALSISRTGGRDYRIALRCAGAGCHLTVKGHQDLQMFAGSPQCLSGYDTHRGHSSEHWIKGKGNRIASRHSYGAWTTGTGCSKEGVTGRINMEANSNR